MKYVIKIDNPTPDVLRQVWFSLVQEEKDMPEKLPEPTSTDAGDMKITLRIYDAKPNVIAGLGKVVTMLKTKVYEEEVKPVEKPEKKKPTRHHTWGSVAKENMKKVSPEAPWGLKVDGTPRIRPGRNGTTAFGSAFHNIFKDIK